MGLLDDRRILVTGVLTPSSIASAIAVELQAEGAEIVLTSFGRARSLTERTARRFRPVPPILELDVTRSEDFESLTTALTAGGDHLDGIVHSIGNAPPDALGGNFLETPWTSVASALQISTYSLQALARACLPLMRARGGSIVTLDFDARVAWPHYDWMGVAKAGLEAVVRYLARDLGRHRIRVNAIAAGPLVTMSAKGIPGFEIFPVRWAAQAPLGWDARDLRPVARAAAVLLSDYLTATTGELLHVDGGYHALGSPLPESGPGPAATD
ncbi:MAG TPA: enoyl-ACP reductase FabI [Verrucomicrobiae bacterium]|nr:enoyl-ACP reductase FabI [Verrucomicrobiae bacterium]